MKTTLNLNDLLLQRAKALAAKHKTSLTRLIEEGLQLRLRTAAMDAKAMHAAAPKIPVFKGKGGMRPGIDPTSNKALLEAAGDDA